MCEHMPPSLIFSSTVWKLIYVSNKIAYACVFIDGCLLQGLGFFLFQTDVYLIVFWF